MMLLFLVVASSCTLVVGISIWAHRPPASTWERSPCGHPAGPADMPTRWAAAVSASVTPLPAYPRPRMARGSAPTLTELRDRGDANTWMNLNGLWEWEAVDCTVPRKPCAGMNPQVLCCPEGNYSTIPPFGQTLAKSILVPFPQESCLSGVAPRTSDDVAMRSWYRLTFDMSPSADGRRTLLHFGAVDWQALVYMNKQLVANHTGGYDGFSADVTGALSLRENHSMPHELLVFVYDPSETGPQPHGKQRLGTLSNPGELWTIVYTPTTGIWQTVWLETVPQEYIKDVQIDQSSADTVSISVSAASRSYGRTTITAMAFDSDGAKVGEAQAAYGEHLKIKVSSPKHWNPSDAAPQLYDLKVSLSSGDSVMTYFGLRTWSLSPGFGEGSEGPLLEGVDLGGFDAAVLAVKDRAACKDHCLKTKGCIAYVFSNCSDDLSVDNCHLKSWVHGNGELCTHEMRAAKGEGFKINCASEGHSCRTSQTVVYKSSPRPHFNGVPTFFAGALDQSWWPDGQYTAPTDEALEYDLLAAKAMGFNMLRLHQKVNPERWYYFADKHGVAIFQDMPQKYLRQGRSNDTVHYYVNDLKAMVAGRGSHPSILQWTAFNEGDCWAVFTEGTPPSLGSVVEIFKQLDPHRLVDTVSGDPAGGFCPGPACPMGGPATPGQSFALNESGDVVDVHSYPIPSDPRPGNTRTQFGSLGTRYGMIGEYSGLGATPADKQYLPGRCQHQNWCKCTSQGKPSPCHDCASNQTSELALAYVALAQVLQARAASGDISASVMTQVTDVELECDGFMNYDRTLKFSAVELKQIHDAHIEIVERSMGSSSRRRATSSILV